MNAAAETADLRWFERTDMKCGQCGKRATGILRGVRNESYGHHCQRCADKRLKASEKARKAQSAAA